MRKQSRFLVVVLLSVALLLPGCTTETNSTQNQSKQEKKIQKNLIEEFKANGLPIGNVIVYDEKTDPNSLLGRPNQYNEKISFEDISLKELEDKYVGTIEKFNSKTDLENRKKYIESIAASTPMFAQYIYVNENLMLRLDKTVLPSSAEKYKKVLDNFNN